MTADNICHWCGKPADNNACQNCIDEVGLNQCEMCEDWTEDQLKDGYCDTCDSYLRIREGY